MSIHPHSDTSKYPKVMTNHENIDKKKVKIDVDHKMKLLTPLLAKAQIT